MEFPLGWSLLQVGGEFSLELSKKQDLIGRGEGRGMLEAEFCLAAPRYFNSSRLLQSCKSQLMVMLTFILKTNFAFSEHTGVFFKRHLFIIVTKIINLLSAVALIRKT
jgi:hypothetical protein